MSRQAFIEWRSRWTIAVVSVLAVLVMVLVDRQQASTQMSEHVSVTVLARTMGVMLLNSYRDVCPTDPGCWKSYVDMYYPGEGHPPWLDADGNPV